MTRNAGRKSWEWIGVLGCLLLVSAGPGRVKGTRALEPPASVKARVLEAYGNLPLAFEPHRDQTDRRVRFLARGPAYSLFLAPTEAVLALHKPHQGSLAPAPGERERVRGPTSAAAEPPGAVVVRMELVGANAKPQVTGLDELPGTVHYFLGNDPQKWRTDVPTYAKVHYRDVYPGIDLVYYGTQRHLEYDFLVAPGADPSAITLAFQGAEPLERDVPGRSSPPPHGQGGAPAQAPHLPDAGRHPPRHPRRLRPESALRNRSSSGSSSVPTTPRSPSSLTRS